MNIGNIMVPFDITSAFTNMACGHDETAVFWNIPLNFTGCTVGCTAGYNAVGTTGCVIDTSESPASCQFHHSQPGPLHWPSYAGH
jgi:hypothetical protein